MVLDCRFKPDKDTILSTQIEYFNYKQFRDKTIFGKVFWLFSKEAVQGGKLQTYLENLPIPKKAGKTRQLKLNFGTYKAIDHDFLEFIETIRKDIAVAVYHSQPSLKNYELTETVQKILDRLVFIRFLEDKSIENDSVIEAIYNSPYPWAKYVEECKRLNAKYNGIVFKEAFFDNADFLAKDNKPFKDIVFEFSANESPYNFNYIPIEIIGNIYERFLGKTIEIIDKKVNIDFKPLERKAGGVFYTPTYIVEYIVKNTVSKLIQGKEPKEIAKMSFADISCGSGSFLIGVYDFLLQYHTRYYNENPDQAKKDKCGYNTENRVFYLTLNQKKQILLNNIYGVDIDSQATEVAQLSLFLKLLENENLFSTDKLDMFGSDKILPNLTNNIKCGNTLIGNDFYAQTQLNLYNEDEQRKINVFDFEPSFPKVFQNGGFNAIVGNPPYVNVENIEKESRNYYYNNYKTCKGRTDIYIAFIEKSMKVLRQNGLYGVIIPYAYTNQNYGSISRLSLLQNYHIYDITDTSSYLVFDEAMVKNIILFVENKCYESLETEIKKLDSKEDFESNTFESFSIKQKEFIDFKDYRLETKNISNSLLLKNKIDLISRPLSSICLVAYGARLNHKSEKINKEHYISKSEEYGFKKFLEGKNIQRYEYSQFGWLNYKPDEHYNSMFPELFESEKLMTINVVADRVRFSYDNQAFYNSHTVINCVKHSSLLASKHSTARKAVKENDVELSQKYNLKFLLGILNSKLIIWYFMQFQSESLHFYPNDVKSLPIPKIETFDKLKETELIRYVDTIMELKKQLHTTLTDSSKERLKNQINSIEYSIDRLVYGLYGLSSEDIEVIESSLAKKD